MPYKEMQMKLLFLLAAAFFAVPSGVSADADCAPENLNRKRGGNTADPRRCSMRGNRTAEAGIPCYGVCIERTAESSFRIIRTED